MQTLRTIIPDTMSVCRFRIQASICPCLRVHDLGPPSQSTHRLYLRVGAMSSNTTLSDEICIAFNDIKIRSKCHSCNYKIFFPFVIPYVEFYHRQASSLISAHSRYPTLSKARLQALAESKRMAILRQYWVGKHGREALDFMVELGGVRSAIPIELKDAPPPQAYPSHVRFFLIMLVSCNADFHSTHLISLPYRSLLPITQHT